MFNTGIMNLTDDQERLKALLTETVTLLVKNGLHFHSEVSIDGVIGITVDKSNVLLVSIRENMKLCKGSPSTKNKSGRIVRKSSQSRDVLFSAPCMASGDLATISEPHDGVDSETYYATTQSETSFLNNIAAENQNTELSASALFVGDLTPSVNTTDENNDSHSEAVAFSTSNMLPGSFQEKSMQYIDEETLSEESMSSSHNEVNVKHEMTEQEAQSDHSAGNSDAEDKQLSAATVEIESESVSASSADRQSLFRRMSLSARTADLNKQVSR